VKKVLIIAAIAAVWAACSSTQLYKPTELNAQKSGSPLPELQQGRKLYVKHCSSCHNLHRPSEFIPVRWAATLEKMQPRAKISNPVKQLIYNYLVSE
jgi:mono/diheme cytochrome c family protein